MSSGVQRKVYPNLKYMNMSASNGYNPFRSQGGPLDEGSLNVDWGLNESVGPMVIRMRVVIWCLMQIVFKGHRVCGSIL